MPVTKDVVLFGFGFCLGFQSGTTDLSKCSLLGDHHGFICLVVVLFVLFYFLFDH